MERRRLGQSDIEVSVLGMGCWQLDTVHWGSTEADGIATVHAALDGGVNLFDTAEGYGQGASERILGKALAGRRDRAVVATKISASHLAVDQVRPTCDASLERLGMNHIDLYQIHWPTRQVPMDDAMAELLKLQDEGKIRAIGVSNFDCQQMDLVRSRGPIASLQPPFSLFWRGIEEAILPYCRRFDIGVLAYSPLMQGLLTGKFTRENRPPAGKGRNVLFNSPEAYDACMAAVDRMRPIADRLGLTLAAMALQWVLGTEGVTVALVGARVPSQIEANVKAVEDVRLTPDARGELDRISREALAGLTIPSSMWDWYPDKQLDEARR